MRTEEDGESNSDGDVVVEPLLLARREELRVMRGMIFSEFLLIVFRQQLNRSG